MQSGSARSGYVSGIAIAVVAGLLLRLWFCVGYVGGFPQDDGIYVNLARLLNVGADLTARYHHLDPAYLANPAEHFTFRIAYIYPLAWCFRLFGEGDAPASAIGIAGALLSIVVVAEIARISISERAGIAAALLLAALPHDIILTTRVLTDGLLRLFVAIACLFVIRGWQNWSRLAFGGAGFALGLAYITKMPGAALFAMLGIVLAIECVRRRTPSVLVSYAAGFALVFIPETMWYWWRTGEFLLHYRIVRSAIFEEFETKTFVDVGSHLRVLWEGEFPSYLRLVLGIGPVGASGLAGFGFQGWIWLGGLALTWRTRAPQARTLCWIAVGLYLFLEGFPIDIRLVDGRLDYELVVRQWRFASLLTPAWVPLGGGALAWLWERSRVAATLVAAACMVVATPELARLYDVFRGSQADLRAAAAFVEYRPERIFTDQLARSTLQYYIGSPQRASHIFDIATIGEKLPGPGDLVVTGGSRNIELLASAWEPRLPAWCRAVLDADAADLSPPGWRVLFRVRGSLGPTRQHDLLVLQYGGT